MSTACIGSSNAAKAIDGRASSLREFGRRPRRYPPTPGPKTFCMLVMDMPRCWLAYQLLLNLPAEGDSLRLVHVYEDAPEKVGPAQDLKAKYEAFLKDKSTKFEVTFELIAKPRGAKTSATIQEKMDEFEGRAGISFLIMAPAMPEKSSNADLVREKSSKDGPNRSVRFRRWTPEYVAIATHPREHVGSVSDYLIKNYAGNLIVFKGENKDAPC